MPELPEAQTIADGLRRHLVGRRISRLHVNRKDILNVSPQRLRGNLIGRKVLAVDRRGKKVFWELEGERILVFSLGMSGQLYLLPANEEPPLHTHLTIEFEGLEVSLIFRDIRRFGRVNLERGLPSQNSESVLSKLGPDALVLSELEFVALFAGRKRRLKPLLLDQEFICGLGNIYTDETLFRAGLHPLRRCDDLGEGELRRLFQAMREVLAEAIASGGSSVSDYVDAGGETGSFQVYHRVYGCESEPCPMCGEIIKKFKVGGRGTYYCPRCQVLE